MGSTFFPLPALWKYCPRAYVKHRYFFVLLFKYHRRINNMHAKFEHTFVWNCKLMVSDKNRLKFEGCHCPKIVFGLRVWNRRFHLPSGGCVTVVILATGQSATDNRLPSTSRTGHYQPPSATANRHRLTGKKICNWTRVEFVSLRCG